MWFNGDVFPSLGLPIKYGDMKLIDDGDPVDA